jgi:serine/threonine-protein kinase
MPDTLDRLRERLTGRYRIERELGRGGMATVFLAVDEHHDRSVALKVLHPDLAATLGSERFQREIRLAARLQHPHILSVYDSGDADGILWFTMPFVEGASLRDRLSRGELPIPEAVRIAREVALALDFAHRHGVVHRDIKPENILLIDGQALVADFGIARALTGEGAVTQTGLAVGTPGYMSPEQASGEHALDARVDIYALGAVLYEMLAGEPPFTGPNAGAIIARMMTETPRPITAVRNTVPPALATLVASTLARSPADRPATARAVATTLEEIAARPDTGVGTAAIPSPERRRRALWAFAAVVALLAVLAPILWRRVRADQSGYRIAVLPFDNAGGNDDDYFADGVTDEVRSKLSAIPGLQVTARTSTSQYKKSKKDPRDIGRELSVDYLLMGTVRWARGQGGDRVRVTPELIQVSNASQRWSEPFDTVLSDVFSVQANIASRVADRLHVALAVPEQQRLAERPTANLDAYEEFLQGEKITSNLGVSDSKVLNAGIPHYERAVTLDSNFMQGWASLGRALSYVYGQSPSVEGVERARVAAERALALGSNKAVSHLAMAQYLRNIKLDYEAARAQYDAALKIEPNQADALSGIATMDRILGRFDDALAHAQQAFKIDPRSIGAARRVAMAYDDLRRYPEELAAWDRALALAPDNLAMIQGKSFNYLSMGHLDSVHALVADKLRIVDTSALLVRFSLYEEEMWALPPALWPKIVKLTVKDFDNDRGHWGLKVGHTYRLMGDTAHGRAFGDTALGAFEAQLRAFPNRAELRELWARSLALAGHKTEAILQADSALKVRETTNDASLRPYVRFQAARVFIQSGDYDKALDIIETLVTTPASHVTPAYLKLDPSFAPLRGNPRFEKLVVEKK